MKVEITLDKFLWELKPEDVKRIIEVINDQDTFDDDHGSAEEQIRVTRALITLYQILQARDAFTKIRECESYLENSGISISIP